MSLNRDSCFMPQPTSPLHPGSSQPVILLQFKRIIPRRTSTPQEQLAKHSVYGRLIVGGGVEIGADHSSQKETAGSTPAARTVGVFSEQARVSYLDFF